MAATVRSYIATYVQDGFSVGIVEFFTYARTVAAIQMITGQEVRDHLLAAVPIEPGGSTDIGAGLQLCQQVSFNLV